MSIEQLVPRHWRKREYAKGAAIIMFDPAFGHLVEKPWSIENVEKDKRHSDTLSVGSAAVSDSEEYGLQAITRNSGPAFEKLRKAREAGVNVEEPIAVYHNPDYRRTYFAKDKPLWVFKRIIGVTLYSFLKNEHSPEKRKAILKGVVGELRKVHAANVFHGDAYAGNILIDKQNKIHLIDLPRTTKSPQGLRSITEENELEKDEVYRLWCLQSPSEDFARLYASTANQFTKTERTWLAKETKVDKTATEWHRNQLGIAPLGFFNRLRWIARSLLPF